MLDYSQHILVYSGSVDMRKSINGLCILTRLSNHTFERAKAFVFFNKNLDKVKILVKEPNGFVLLYKRLDAGTFKISFGTVPFKTIILIVKTGSKYISEYSHTQYLNQQQQKLLLL
jgi:hypothetical protein